jgi:hypothetical protein
LSPLAMSQNLEEFLNSLAGGRTEDTRARYRGMLTQQCVFRWIRSVNPG